MQENTVNEINGNVNFNNYITPYSETIGGIIIELSKHVRYLEKELRGSRVSNSKLIGLLNAQTDRLIEKDMEIRELRRLLDVK